MASSSNAKRFKNVRAALGSTENNMMFLTSSEHQTIEEAQIYSSGKQVIDHYGPDLLPEHSPTTERIKAFILTDNLHGTITNLSAFWCHQAFWQNEYTRSEACCVQSQENDVHSTVPIVAHDFNHFPEAERETKMNVSSRLLQVYRKVTVLDGQRIGIMVYVKPLMDNHKEEYNTLLSQAPPLTDDPTKLVELSRRIESNVLHVKKGKYILQGKIGWVQQNEDYEPARLALERDLDMFVTLSKAVSTWTKERFVECDQLYQRLKSGG